MFALLPASAAADGLPAVGVDANPVSNPGDHVEYQTEKAGKGTRVVESARYGGELRARRISGEYSIPAVAYDGSPSGLSADGRTLVLINPRLRFPRELTTLAVIDTRTLRVRRTIALPGDFSFDAISPNGRVMYLIEYLNPRNFTEYDVRAYNMRTHRLYKRPVVDPNESGEDMYGTPVSRVSSRDGRWHYTLYEARGHPFVHALDTVGRTAVCIDIEGGVKSVWNATLQPRGPRLEVVDQSGRPLAEIDTRTHEVVWERPPSEPAKSNSRAQAEQATEPEPDAGTLMAADRGAHRHAPAPGRGQPPPRPLKARGARTDDRGVGSDLGPTRPDRLTIWPVEGDQFGIDVRWGGAAGNRRATVVARILAGAGIRGRLTQGVDGAWEVRVGPVPGADVARVIDEFVW